MSFTVRRTLAGLAALAVACVAAAGLAAAPAEASVTGQPTVEAQLLALTNADRASHGLRALRSSSTLQSIARTWSAHQAATGTMAHNPNLFSQVHGWSSMGENVAKAYSASQAESLFMGSAPHRANILNSRYTLVGIGVSRDSSGALWFTIDFEQPSGSTPPPAPKPVTKPVVKPTTSTTTSRRSTATRSSRSSVRTAVTKPVVKSVAPAKPAPTVARLDSLQHKLTDAEARTPSYAAGSPFVVADLSQTFTTPNPVVATTALVGFIGSMALAAAGLLYLGATRSRRHV